MGEIRVFIADDHPLLRDGIKTVISERPGFKVAGEAEDGIKALEGVERLKPDVVLMDISMPGIDGIEATRRIMEKLPETKVIILSMHQNPNYAVDALQAGAQGYVLKGADSDELIYAIEMAVSGKKYISPLIANDILNDFVFKKKEQDPFDTLSEREKEVFKLIVDGGGTKKIAEDLLISGFTVKKHKQNIMKKLNVSDMTGLLRIAIKKGFLKNTDP